MLSTFQLETLFSELALLQTGDVLKQFVEANYTAPRVVLAGAGVSHDELVSCAEPLLAGLPAGSGAPATPSAYVGGDYRLKTDSPITSAVIGFEFAGGWRDTKASTAATVLTMLLGGGGSFSAGGPGKGMYSRLYTRVLNKFTWAQNCTAFHSIFNDTGIVGISAAAEVGRCKLDPGLKAPPVSNFDCEKDTTALST